MAVDEQSWHKPQGWHLNWKGVRSPADGPASAIRAPPLTLAPPRAALWQSCWYEISNEHACTAHFPAYKKVFPFGLSCSSSSFV